MQQPSLASSYLPVIIIRSGMAGYTLARELRKLSQQPIVMVCQDSGASYAKPTLSNAFAQGKMAEAIANADATKMAETLGLTIYNFYHVSHLDVETQTITIHPVLAADKQQVLAYRDLVLATGASPSSLPNLIIDQKTVFAVNHLDDYIAFQQAIKQLIAQKAGLVRVAIIGAGLIGCEFANDLMSQSQTAAHGLKVAVFDKAAVPLALQLPTSAGKMLQSALSEAGVDCYLNAVIEQIHTRASAQTASISAHPVIEIGYCIDDQPNCYEADIVLVATGLVANTRLAEAANITTANHSSATVLSHLPRTAQQGICVDNYLQTSAPHVYAIGDCANVMGSYMPYVMPLMNQAKALAKTLADPTAPPTSVGYPAMPVAIKTPSLPLVVLPVSGQYPDAQITWQTHPTADGMVMTAHPIHDPASLLGFVLVGKEAGKQRLSLAKQVADWLN